MTNKIFSIKLKQLMAAKIKYQKLLNVVEDEIKERHGYFPSDVNFEAYIDNYHYADDCEMSIKEIEKGMIDRIEWFKYISNDYK
jgi:hypothetical protein